MKLWFLGLLLLIPQETDFVAVDIVVDPAGQPLAAWQIELAADAALVGVEGGEGRWKDAPYYDPAALKGGRIVVAAFTLDPEPSGAMVRVARLHFAQKKAADYVPRLVIAAGEDGRPIPARVMGVRR